jgi:hypothetical protein
LHALPTREDTRCLEFGEFLFGKLLLPAFVFRTFLQQHRSHRHEDEIEDE